MLSLISFKKLKKVTPAQRLLPFLKKPKAVLDRYEDVFGTINIYTLYYYYDKEKALNSLLKLCDRKPYMSNSEIPIEYKRLLTCKQLIDREESFESRTLGLYYTPDKQILTELCRRFSKVYLIGSQPPDFLDDIWRECGTVPTVCTFAVNTDITISGNEKPILTSLPPPFDTICPNDFSPTLFAGLLYKENGIFIN